MKIHLMSQWMLFVDVHNQNVASQCTDGAELLCAGTHGNVHKNSIK